MKIRIGFVSNSSSSSFILSTKLNILDLKKFLLDNNISINEEKIETNFYGYAILSGWSSMDNGDEEDLPSDIRTVKNKLIEVYGKDSCMIESTPDY